MSVNVATNRYATSSIIVGTSIADGCMFTSIQDAIDYASANSLQNILIKPGTYTEDIAMISAINVSAMAGSFGIVKIKGKVTMTGAITSSFSYITFETNSDYCLDFEGAGTNQTQFINCKFNCYSDAILLNNSSAAPNFRGCGFNQFTASKKFFVGTSLGSINFRFCYFTNDSGGAAGVSSIAAGNANFYYCNIGGQEFTTSNTGAVNWFYTSRVTNTNSVALTTSGTGTCYFNNVYIESGASAALSIGTGTTVDSGNLTIKSTNSNPITGAGTFTGGPVQFSSSGYGINVTTKTLRNIDAGGISFDYGSNVLSTYESGTWTPSIIGSISNPTVTYTTQAGYYTRVGNIVVVTCQCDINTVSGGSGVVRLSGFPYAFKTSANSPTAILQTNLTMDAGFTYFVVVGSPGNTYATMQELQSATAPTSWPVSNLVNSNIFRFSMSYLV